MNEKQKQQAEKHYQAGLQLLNKQQNQNAIIEFDEAIILNPQLAEAYNNRGFAKQELKRYEEAIADYNEAIKINPQYADAYYNRGLAKQELKRYEEAITDYTEAIKINPQYAEAYNNRGSAKLSLKRYEEAITDYKKAISLNPQHVNAHYNLGLLYRLLGKEKEALKNLKQAQELDPTIIVKEETKKIKEEVKETKGKTEKIEERIDKNLSVKEFLGKTTKFSLWFKSFWLLATVIMTLFTFFVIYCSALVSIAKDIDFLDWLPFISADFSFKDKFQWENLIFFYSINLFSILVTLTCYREYGREKQFTKEADNRLAMMDFLSTANDFLPRGVDKTIYEQNFISRLADAVVYSLRDEKTKKKGKENTKELLNLLHQLTKLTKK